MSIQSWSVSRRGRTRFGQRRQSDGLQTYADPPPRRGQRFRATLRGANQVPPVLSSGTGSFQARIAADESAIEYVLTFSNLTTPARVAHIHFGHATDNGGIMAFLCGGGDKGACPGEGGSVSGTITAADIQAIPSQGLAAGDLASVIRLMRAGLVYVNVHTPTFPEGEIRGQVRS